VHAFSVDEENRWCDTFLNVYIDGRPFSNVLLVYTFFFFFMSCSFLFVLKCGHTI
jgi:hypothetical protein